MSPIARRRASRPVAWVLLAVAIAVAALHAVVPRLPGADRIPVLFLAAAFNTLFVLGGVVVVVIIAVVLFVQRQRRFAIVTVGVAVLLTAVLVATLPSQPVRAESPQPPQPGTVRILSWNTNQQAVEGELSSLVRRTKPDVIVLPEYFPGSAEATLGTLADQQHMSIYGWDSSAASVLVSDRLGRYRLNDDDTPPWAGFYLEPDRPSSPRLVIAHLQRPSVGTTATWREHLGWAARKCSATNVIAAGDFNATLTNLGGDYLGECRDAAATLGVSSTGTWPTTLPAWLGASIDHVFLGTGWTAEQFVVLSGADTGGSDHRPVFSIVRRNSEG